MSYEAALVKAWLEIEGLTKEKNFSIKFLVDEYTIDLVARRILSSSCNVPAKEYISILILHYLIRKLKGLPQIIGEWIDFRQLDGGQGYYPNFKKRIIGPILRKYGSNPDEALNLTKRFRARQVQLGDIGVVLEVFEGVDILIEIWKSDAEFGPEVNVLFDRSIKDIFCTEDIVILAEFIAHSI